MYTLNQYCDMVDFIARKGVLKARGAICGYIGVPVFENTIDSFAYISHFDSQAVEVIHDHDPFLSRWFDGNLCRKHIGRYEGIEKIKQHFIDNGGILPVSSSQKEIS